MWFGIIYVQKFEKSSFKYTERKINHESLKRYHSDQGNKTQQLTYLVKLMVLVIIVLATGEF